MFCCTEKAQGQYAVFLFNGICYTTHAVVCIMSRRLHSHRHLCWSSHLPAHNADEIKTSEFFSDVFIFFVPQNSIYAKQNFLSIKNIFSKNKIKVIHSFTKKLLFFIFCCAIIISVVARTKFLRNTFQKIFFAKVACTLF